MSEAKEKLSKTAGSGDIRCPFFSAHGKTTIRCKDIYPETQSVTTVFRNKESKKFHTETYCEGHYQKCWLYCCAMELMWSDE